MIDFNPDRPHYTCNDEVCGTSKRKCMINPSEKQTNKQTNLLKFLYMVIMQNLTEFILIAIPGPQVQICTYVIWYVASVW